MMRERELSNAFWYVYHCRMISHKIWFKKAGSGQSMAQGKSAPVACRDAGISRQCYYR
jgi:hypothetical protein